MLVHPCNKYGYGHSTEKQREKFDNLMQHVNHASLVIMQHDSRKELRYSSKFHRVPTIFVFQVILTSGKNLPNRFCLNI